MNVQKGDLAVTVTNGKSNRTATRNSGRLVEVLEWVGHYEYAGGAVGNDTWRVLVLGGPLVDSMGIEWSGEVYIPDQHLRPIRPGDISDEEVRDLYKPEPTKETV